MPTADAVQTISPDTLFMKDRRPHTRPISLPTRRGFTLLELLLVTGIIALLIAIALPAFGSMRRSARSVKCLANLRQISSALHQYAMDNGGMFPDPFVNQVSWEASLKSYLPSEQSFICPADSEVAPVIGSSYDWRDTGQPGTTIAGRALDSISRPSAVLAFDALAEWHAKGKVNAVLFNGSAQQMTVRECFGDLIVPVR